MATYEQSPDLLTIRDRALKVTAKVLIVDEATVTDESNFRTDLNADSLDLVELVMAFDEEFGIEIPDVDAEKIATFGDAVKRITEKVGGEKKAA